MVLCVSCGNQSMHKERNQSQLFWPTCNQTQTQLPCAGKRPNYSTWAHSTKMPHIMHTVPPKKISKKLQEGQEGCAPKRCQKCTIATRWQTWSTHAHNSVGGADHASLLVDCGSSFSFERPLKP
jgi:hypothetical protein